VAPTSIAQARRRAQCRSCPPGSERDARKEEAAAGPCGVVTGPVRGIGRAIAHRLAENGAQVALVDHDAATLTAVATALGAEGLSVIALSADIASLEQFTFQ
jgi:short-subunit dehydrogenase